MPIKTGSKNFAVLIDADNETAKIADRLFEEVSKFGRAHTRRIYGDFSAACLNPWKEILPRHAISPYQQFAYSKGKNSSDIAMVIDTMDLLHRGDHDGFCLVSSDSDFTRLAMRIREEGKEVIGFGQKKTPEAFQQACHNFVFTEGLNEKRQACARSSLKTAPGTKNAPCSTKVIRKALGVIQEGDSLVGLGALGNQLRRDDPEFKTKKYGAKKLIELVRGNSAFILERDKNGVNFVRLNPNA